MKKISSRFANNFEYVLRPFALVNHEHTEYLLRDSTTPINVSSPINFTGPITGIPGLADPLGVTDGYVLTVDTGLAVWAAPTGGTGGGTGDYNIDGGKADSVYTAQQAINGGGA